MRKYVTGMLVGIVLTITTTAYASDSIQAFLYSVKYIINGKADETPIGYQTLNYDGHAYVPLRYISEKMGTAIVFDDDTKSITLDDNFTIPDPRNFIVKAGHLLLTKNSTGTSINGKLYFSQTYLEMLKVNVRAADGSLVFWNAEGEIIDKALFKVNIEMNKDQIVDFQTTTLSDVTNYAAVTLEGTTPYILRHGFYYLTTKDTENKIMIGMEQLVKSSLYTAGTLQIGSFIDGRNDIDAIITFYDKQGNVIGDAQIHAAYVGGPLSPDVQQPVGPSIPFIANGDVTNYQTFSVKVNTITPSKN